MEHDKDEKAIVIACFGARDPKALAGITTIKKEVQKTFPRAKVKIAFTSNIIRKIWRERQRDKGCHIQVKHYYKQGVMAGDGIK